MSLLPFYNSRSETSVNFNVIQNQMSRKLISKTDRIEFFTSSINELSYPKCSWRKIKQGNENLTNLRIKVLSEGN